jgi:hypothetical protein
VRPLILTASRALWPALFPTSGIDFTGLPRVSLDALSRAAELPLELHDDLGLLVPTDFVNIVERPIEGQLPVVFARLRLSPSGKDAPLVPRTKGQPDVGEES